MTGSKRKIEKKLWEMFYDGIALEYIATAYSRSFILNQIRQTDQTTEWDDIYAVIKNWQRACDKYYDGIYNENKLLLEAGVTDTRNICENKYQNFLSLISNDKKVPLYYDKDIKEYRVVKTLKIYEEIVGEQTLKYHRLRNENLTNLAKRGGQLPSGVDSRKIIYDMFEDNKKFEERANNPKLTDRLNQMFKELEKKEA